MPTEYAQKLGTARKSQEMQGERRIVTILFCDVKGSTAMAEQLDPEDWTEIMNRAFEYLITPIFKYEGTLARLMGDAILAFFGAPIAHEDDAERAVLASLEIVNEIQPFIEQVKSEYGLDFNVRVGINTGLVVVGGVGSDLFMEYTALGDAINIASRMEQTAQPGTIQIAEDTYTRVAPLFQVIVNENIKLKGINNPVQAYQVTGLKQAPGRTRGIRGLDTHLVGRIPEMDQMKLALNELKAGRGQIISLIGEAGLGKSRIIREIRNIWESTNIDGPKFGNLPLRWNQVAGVSYETASPYGLIQRFIRNFIGVTDTDSPERVKKQLVETFSTSSIQASNETISVFETLLGIDENTKSEILGGEELKRIIYRQLSSMLRLLIQDTPTILVMDDLHWSDPASAEFLIHLFQLADHLPVLFLCAFRPERSSPAWKIKQAADTDYSHRYLEIELSPLSVDDSGKLVDSLLTVSDLPPDLRKLILNKSDGNPFFVEEVIRSLIDNGVVVRDSTGSQWRAIKDVKDISIPSSLQALLAARIDRMEDSAKRVLQLASVIGRSFYHQVLEIINDASDDLGMELNKLQRLELIIEEAREPYLEYLFKHALTQETAYNTILLKHRREFHQRVGEALLQLYADRAEDFTTVIGYHFYQARDPRALEYFIKAGDTAFRLYAIQEAIEYYSHAVEVSLWSKAPDLDQLNYLFSRRGRSFELSSQFDDALENYREMEKVGKKFDSQKFILDSLILQAQIFSIPSNMFDPDRGEKLIQKGMVIAKNFQDKQAQGKLYWILANLYRFTNKSEFALETGEKAIALAREVGDEELLAYALNDNSHNHVIIGSVSKALKLIQEASDLWRKLNNKAMLADSLSGFASSSTYLGNYEDALKYSDEAYNISASIDNIWGKAYSKYAVGIIYWERGEIDKAIKVIEQVLQDSIHSKFSFGQVMSMANLSMIYTSLGMAEKAAEQLTFPGDGEPKSSFLSQSFLESFRILADIALGDLQKAEEKLENRSEQTQNELSVSGYYEGFARSHFLMAKADYQHAIEHTLWLIKNLENKGFVYLTPKLYHFIGIAHFKLDQTKLAQEYLEKALEKAESCGSRRMLWKILLELSKLDGLKNNLVLAEDRLAQAQEHIYFIADHISSQEMRDSFLAQPEVLQALNGNKLITEKNQG
jgi:class 3 adenylate cyclase/tetratricopeptide (TPR) repeat protein